jgi:hypothetical protein
MAALVGGFLNWLYRPASASRTTHLASNWKLFKALCDISALVGYDAHIQLSQCRIAA